MARYQKSKLVSEDRAIEKERWLIDRGAYDKWFNSVKVRQNILAMAIKNLPDDPSLVKCKQYLRGMIIELQLDLDYKIPRDKQSERVNRTMMEDYLTMYLEKYNNKTL